MTELDEEMDRAYFDGVKFGYQRALKEMAEGKLKPPRAKHPNLSLAARFLAAACSLASLCFMGFVFFNESVLRRGVLFIEPNTAMATGELATVCVAISAALLLFLRDLSRELA